MKISPEEVKKIARLASLTLSEEEIRKYSRQLGQILEYMELLNELDTSNVEPLSHVLETVNMWRDDEPESGLSREDVLKNAPNHDGIYFKVPKVL
jgi:aspartyl-tRNA(Asn)/glutamyl-tRNA(Gln) amidotransferase subunit C